MRRTVLLFALALIGCGGVGNVSKNPDHVDVSGTVKLDGKPVADATLNFQPTGGTALPAVVPVNNGNFQGKVTPGKYTYYLSEGVNKAELAAVPQKFKEGSMDRQVDVSAGKALELTFQ